MSKETTVAAGKPTPPSFESRMFGRSSPPPEPPTTPARVATTTGDPPS